MEYEDSLNESVEGLARLIQKKTLWGKAFPECCSQYLFGTYSFNTNKGPEVDIVTAFSY